MVKPSLLLNSFIEINLKNTKVCKVNLANLYNTDVILKNNKTPEERRKNGEAKINSTSEKKRTR